MAEELGFKVVIDGVEKEIESLKELKLATKQAADEQLKASLKYGESSKEYEKASKKVSALKDKLEDLGDSTRSLKGSGIERSTQGFNQLGEGLRNLDFDKVKVGLTAVKSALAATGIMLVVQGVMYLIENFKELSQGSGVVAKALQWVGSVIDGVVDGLRTLSDAIFDTSFQFEKAAEEMIESSKKMSEKTQEAYDDQIKLARAAGKETIELEKKKQLAIRESAFEQIALLEQIRKKTGELTTDQQKQYDDLVKTYKNASIEMKAIDLKAEVDKKAKDQKAAEEYKARLAKEKEEAEKAAAYNASRAKMEADSEVAAEKYLADQAKIISDQKIAYAEQEAQAKASILNDSIEREIAAQKKLEDELKASNQAITDAKIAGLNAGQALADVVGTIALNRAKGNAQKEIEIKKKMFQVDKAFNVARAVQDGIRSVQAALTIPPPGGQILAAVNGVAAAANVAKILATKFDGGNVGNIDTGNTGSTSAPNIGGNINTTAPQVQLPQTQSTQFNQQGQNLTIKAEVVETENRNATNRINRFIKKSEY